MFAIDWDCKFFCEIDWDCRFFSQSIGEFSQSIAIANSDLQSIVIADLYFQSIAIGVRNTIRDCNPKSQFIAIPIDCSQPLVTGVTNEERELTHVHFTKWEDLDTPSNCYLQ